VAVSIDANHAESFNNLGVLEQRKGNDEMAQSNFQAAMNLQEGQYEAHFNAGLLAMRSGAFQESHEFAAKALAAYPEHADSHELMKQLKSYFAML
jgi:tetratricopeptide repeat protein 8